MKDHIRKAVCAIFKYQEKVFYIQRQNYLKAFPGYTAFPGGKVDTLDFDKNEEATLKNALFRECQEELGISLKEILKTTETQCIKIAKATSPSHNPLRYETHFYLIELKNFINLQADSNEAFEYGFKTAKELLADFEMGRRLMVRPIRKTLELLQEKGPYQFVDFDSSLDQKIPCIKPLGSFYQYMPLSHTLPPAQRTNAFIFGDKEKVLVDPSPKNESELRCLYEAIKKHNVSKIFLTHHHGDHHENSAKIAGMLGAEIYLSSDTHRRILHKYGNDYFLSCQLHYAKEGDDLTSWLGKRVIVHEIPGHDEGHLGLSPETKEWFIVGDLFQGLGTVVVGGDEGNMKKYCESLKKVIQYGPDCVIPSHGIALGGTHILERTLKHRLLREEQILKLWQKKNSKDKILKIIYANLPSQLEKYAMANIEAHLQKLKEENKISDLAL